MKAFLTAIVLAALSLSCNAKQVAGIDLPDKISAQSEPLVLNGAGVRTKFFMDIYAAGLYLPIASNQAQTILEGNQPMALRLHVTSGLLSSEKMEEATREGFEQSTGGNTAEIQATIDQFIENFKDAIVENDVFDFMYTPDTGVEVFKNGELKSTIKGAEFKKALFGIWLSDDAVQDDLKQGLLGSL